MAQKQIIDPGFAWDTDYGYSQMVRVGDLLHLAGQLPVDATGAVVGVGDIRAQARQVFTNLATVLAAAGSTLEDIVDATFYPTHIAEDFSPLWEAKNTYLAGNFPAMTVVGVAGLVLPDQRLELKVTALAH